MTYLAPVLISYIIGVVSCYYAQVNNYSSVLVYTFILVLFTLILLKLFLKERFSINFFPVILLFLSLGYFLTFTAISKTKNMKLDFLENKESDFIVRIINITEKNDKKIILTAEIKDIIYDNTPYKTKIPVNIFLDAQTEKPFFGIYDLIRIKKAKLRKPDLPSYPGQFNYQRYLLQKGIAYIIYTSPGEIELVKKDNAVSFYKTIFFMRKNIINLFVRTIHGDSARLLSSMVLGEQNILPENLNEAFIKTGLLHLIAASGFNVTILISFCFFISGCFPSKKMLMSFLLIFIIILYAALCNFSPSITRAAILGIFFLLSVLCNREKDSWHIFILSAFLMLIFKPLWLFDVGFQLSFVSCLGIIALSPVFMKKLKHLPNYLNSLISVTLGAQIFILPLLIYYFGRISSLFLISNLILIPVVEILFPISLVHILLGYSLKILLPITSFLCRMLSFISLKIIYLLANLPFSLIYLKKPSYMTFILFYAVLGVILFSYYKSKERFPVKTILFCLSALILLNTVFKLNNLNNLTVVFLNPKGGDCVFIKTPNGKNILIDTGRRYYFKGNLYDCSDKTIIPYMKQVGASCLDMIIISHPHNDHIGGLLGLIQKNIPIKLVAGNFHKSRLPIAKKIIKLLKIKNIEYMPLDSGDVIAAGKNLNFFVMSAPQRLVNHKKEISVDINNSSAVIKLVYKNASFLFTGDIQKEAERKLMYGFNLKSDILKIAHQGSETSSCDQFIKKVNPEYAVISAEKYDIFGHPDKKVLNILKNNHIKYFITSFGGPVTVKTNGRKLKIYTTN